MASPQSSVEIDPLASVSEAGAAGVVPAGSKPPPLPKQRQHRPAAPSPPPSPPSAETPAQAKRPTPPPAPDSPADSDAPAASSSRKPRKKGRQAAAEPAVEEAPEQRGLIQRLVSSESGGFLFSVVVHLVLLLALAIWMLPSPPTYTLSSLLLSSTDVSEEEELSPEMEPMVTSVAVEATSLSAHSDGSEAVVALAAMPSLDRHAVEQVESVNIGFEGLAISTPGSEKLVSQVPQGTLGDPQAVVDNYDEALDRLTQEILLMLTESKVLVIWLFDQSESMKFDQEEIRKRITRVYGELGLKEEASGDALMSAVASYGEGYLLHTTKPTNDLNEIRASIDEVPNDPSGKENTCSAIGRSLMLHKAYAKSTRRKIAMVVVTDESGERDDNERFTEAVIAEAKAADCRIYYLGREAVFGYPYAHLAWKHPQTGRIHWIPIDRGPETAFVEQLQTECFRRRTDSHPSGFGPYEQCRIAQQTGGIFFMLPSFDTRLKRGDNRRYELAAMRPYLPDLGPRHQQLQQRDQSILRTVVSKIINDLNPYRPQVAEAMEVRFRFSARPDAFVKQVLEEQERARRYILYLDAATKAMDEIRPHRQSEYNPRWQANYDLIYAQLLAYTARTYEYGAYLENFKNNPKVVPLEKPGNVRLTSWDIRETKSTVGGEWTEAYIDRAHDLFHQVIADYAGTPWAARAEWELSRGFGVELHEHYTGPSRPRPPSKPRPKLIPVPKL